MGSKDKKLKDKKKNKDKKYKDKKDKKKKDKNYQKNLGPIGSGEMILSLDSPKTTFRAGETIKGTVQYTPSDPGPQQLAVQVRWVTDGSRDLDAIGFQQTILHDGGWQIGVAQIFPFVLRAPGGPMAYQGELIKSSWEVYASLLEPPIEEEEEEWDEDEEDEDDDWDEDEEEEVVEKAKVLSEQRLPVVIELSPDRGYSFGLRSVSTRPIGSLNEKGEASWLLWFGPLAVLAGIGLTIVQLRGDRDPTTLIFGVLIALLGGFYFFRALKRWWQVRSTVGVELEVEPRILHAGGKVEAILKIFPKSDIELSSGSFTLAAIERGGYHKGGNLVAPRTSKELFSSVKSIEKRSLREPLVLRESFTIPSDAAPTLLAERHLVLWTVLVKMTFSGGLIFSRKVELGVVPPTAGLPD